MKKVLIRVQGVPSAVLTEEKQNQLYTLCYLPEYSGGPISLTLPISIKTYTFNSFPPFFDGLLPEGIMLDSLLRIKKIDASDYLAQLLAIGSDLAGVVTVEPLYE